MEREIIIESVTKLFIGTDERDWDRVLNAFSGTVELDYSSMTGSKPANLNPAQIINSWKTVLPGFDSTHHQLGNFLVAINGRHADVFCYGMASHYLKNDSDNNIWTVAGTYNFELDGSSDSWKITKMKFNFKYMDGNTGLPVLAQKKLEKTIQV